MFFPLCLPRASVTLFFVFSLLLLPDHALGRRMAIHPRGVTGCQCPSSFPFNRFNSHHSTISLFSPSPQTFLLPDSSPDVDSRINCGPRRRSLFPIVPPVPPGFCFFFPAGWQPDRLILFFCFVDVSSLAGLAIPPLDERVPALPKPRSPSLFVPPESAVLPPQSSPLCFISLIL